ncbi:HAD-IA family hydrolase [Streptomyces sp. NBC_01549]|uniref:HAD-IA family hydrolase n=1 Tax=Streptomyces sp. NBC_01549 TaxID=2975874 RepID=UPI0022588410|nr:HAD-IA family hydrolase [Streptomyces sp. NBC_01549]MCX4593237.1 HAD-IA family hydrolase [Streptomyces sp. NBC_01549]
MRHAIWTDFRGVLTPPLREGLRTYCEGKEFTPEQLGRCLRAIADRHGRPDGMAVLDSGVLTEREWTAEIEQELSARFGLDADLSGLGPEWWSDRRIDTKWLAALRTWREAGAFVGMISNLPPDWREYFADFRSWDDLFDEVLLSCDIGVRKPDAAMFRLAETRSGLPPESNVLVDDLDDNVAGARRAGWVGVVGGGDSTWAAVERIDSIVRVGAPHHVMRVGAPHQGAER